MQNHLLLKMVQSKTINKHLWYLGARRKVGHTSIMSIMCGFNPLQVMLLLHMGKPVPTLAANQKPKGERPKTLQHILQLFLHVPQQSGVPNMNTGFFWHSPVAAHWEQLSSSSVHSSPSDDDDDDDNDNEYFRTSKAFTRIHLVADHFSPSTTGQLPWRLLLSVAELRWRLKRSSAFPLMDSIAYSLIAQSDHILSSD